jgi:hypothetical protein
VALGTDTVHAPPGADGASVGRPRSAISTTHTLGEARAVVLNLGSP